jgi:ribosomal protein L11 methyltransferase
VEAFDFDPDAVRIARNNAAMNKVARKIQLARKDIAAQPRTSARKYDLICANLISDLLVAQRDRIAKRLKAGGRLVVAGILKLQFGDVQKAYEKAGLRLIASRTENEWRSGAFEFDRRRQKIPEKLKLR